MKRLFFFAAMASVALYSCDKQDESGDVPPPAEIHFTNVTSLDVIMRAETPKDFTADFNVFIPGVTEATKVVTYAAGPTWTFEGGAVLVDRTGGTLVAWAPKDLAATGDASSVKYTLTAQKDAAAEDLIYQHQAVTSVNADAVAVQMTHAYSKLSFKVEVKADGGYTGAGTLTAVKVTSGIFTNGVLDMSTGNLVSGAAISTPIELAAADKLLVVPSATKPSIDVTCTIDGTEFTKTVSASNMATLEAGTEYEITLTLVGQTTAVASVKEVPWSKATVDGGEIM